MSVCGSAGAAKSYFREALSRGEYYLAEKILDQEVVGLWGGRGAERLGLDGLVRGSEFNDLCDNLHPETSPHAGERLTPRTKSERRVAYDINFHVPKSVSVALELGGDRRIIEAFESAVRATMAEMEREIETRVRRNGENASRRTGELVWASFRHHTARPVEGVPDPHLHMHCVGFNATFDQVEDRWKAADFGAVKADAPYFQSAYHARLKCNLVELGYEIERTPDGWEIAGIPGDVNQAFSRRTEEIERLARERGITEADRKAELGVKTREAKMNIASMEELRSSWLERITPEQHAAIERTRACAHERADSGDIARDPGRELAQGLDGAIAHVFERQSTTPDRHLLASALDRTTGSVSPEAMTVYTETRIAEGHLLRGRWEGRSLLTTPGVHAEEQAMLAIVREGRGQHPPLHANHAIRDEQLSHEQRSAVRHVLESNDSVVLIRGRAGAGKTRLMQEVVAAIRGTGTRIQPVAPTAHATHEVLREDGHTNAQTVAALLANPDLRRNLKGGVLWMDEAGQASVPDMLRTLTLAKDAGARVILTGDTAQHSSVIRGDAMRLMEAFGGIRAAEVREIRRQSHERYRVACETLARGDIAKGFGELDRMGSVREVPDADRSQEIARSYAESVKEGHGTLVISPTHAEGGRVTRAIREKLKDQKLLCDRERPVDRLVPRHLTKSERSDPSSFRVGDVVEFHQNAKGGFRRGDRGEVTRIGKDMVTVKRDRDQRSGPLPLATPDRYGVYERSTLGLAKGDRVRITSNGRTKDNKHRLNNGSLYTLTGRTGAGDLKLDNGWVVDKRFGHVAHGYCVTSDASQGRGVKHVLIAQSAESAPASNAKQFYVSVTRGKDKVTVFTDDKKRLLENVSRLGDRVSATELMRSAAQPPKALGLEHRQQIGRWLQMRHAQELGRRGRERASRTIQRTVSIKRSRRRGRGMDRGQDRGAGR